jgi:hypothetical protein
VTDRPRQGEHRAHIAVATAAGTDHCSIVLAKGRRDRPGEEDLVARAVVLWLARACGIAALSPRTLLDDDERYSEAVVQTGDLIDQLLAGGLARVTAWPDGQLAQGDAGAERRAAGLVQPAPRRASSPRARRPRTSASSPWRSRSP